MIAEKCEHPNTHTVRTGANEWILDCDDCGYQMAKITASSDTTPRGWIDRRGRQE